MIARLWTRTSNFVVAILSRIRKADTLALRASAYQRIEDRIHDQMRRNKKASLTSISNRNISSDVDGVGLIHLMNTKRFMRPTDTRPQFFGSDLTTRSAQAVWAKFVLVWHFLSTSELLGLKKERRPVPAGSSLRDKRIL